MEQPDAAEEGGVQPSAACFRALIERSFDALALIGADGIILYASPSTSRILGYTPAELVGRPALESMHPDDLPRMAELFAQLVQSPGRSITSPYRYRHKDGSWRWLEGTGTNLLGEPAVRAIVANYRDITEQRRTVEALQAHTHGLQEQQKWLEALVDLLPVPTLLIEPGTARVMFANRAADAMAGGEFPKGKPAEEYHTVYHGTDARGQRIPDEQMPGVRAARGERLDGFEMDWHTPAGKRSLLVYGDTLPTMHGHPGMTVVMFQDVSRLKQAETELRRANQAKDEFLAMLAHELRGPLAPISNGMHLLRLPEVDARDREQTGAMVERQLRHLTRLVDDLLDVSRLTRGKVRLKQERLDLARLVRGEQEWAGKTALQAGLDLAVQTPETPVWVLGDTHRLVQVVAGLLDNAVKFTDRGGRVEVRLSVLEGQAVLRVADTGVGMEAEMLARLFEPFSQADRSLHRTRGGLGLGLALARGLVELHGGTIRAHSAGPGRGTEIIVRLPVQPEPPALTGPARVAARQSSRLRILIVEDNRDAADSLRLLLELAGHQVRVAYAGLPGVETARAWQPDAVICDIGLPGLDGFGVARRLREQPETARARLIAITGYGSDEDRRRARESGFDHFFTKPADPVDLQQVLAGSAEPPGQEMPA
jgi:PAS domain S-box-containing protein